MTQFEKDDCIYQSKYDYYKLGIQFIDACRNDDVEKLHFLLTSDELYKKVDIHFNKDQGFKSACLTGSIYCVRYLLASSDITEHIDIHTHNDIGIINAAVKHDLPLMKYLLNSPELKEHANVHAKNDAVFNSLCGTEINTEIEYLILDYKITLTPTIQKMIQNKPSILELFNKREFYLQLKKDLIETPVQTKKTKI